MQFLADEGYLADSQPAHIRSADLVVDSYTTPNNRMARLFELLLDQRLAEPLRSFSIGPTQMLLMYSPALGGTTTIPGRFSSLDEIQQFYYAPDISMMMAGPWFDYLRTDAASYPTPSSNTCGGASGTNCIESYLQAYQTGAVNWSDASWQSYAAKFLNNVQGAWSRATTAGYSVG
jgi:hypothetical protein